MSMLKAHPKLQRKLTTVFLVLWSFVIMFFCFGILVIGFKNFGEGLGSMFRGICTTDIPNRIENTENLAKFTFPPSATNMQVSCDGLNAWSAEASFDMLPEDLDAFVASTLIQESDLVSTIPSGLANAPAPLARMAFTNNMNSLLYGIHNSSYDFQQEILIDTSDPERYKVVVLVQRG